MRFIVVVLFSLITLGGCQKEPEVVNVNKVIKCFGSKGALKQKACRDLNDAEKQALECLTSKDSSKKCSDASFNEMQFLIERERGHAKQRGTHFNLSAPAK